MVPASVVLPGGARGRVTRLGSSGEQAMDGKQATPPQERTPLPVRQIFVLCLMRFAEPISFSVIFPFVNQMIEEIGVTDDPKAIGYYSGLVEGVFALAQFCTVCFWGSLSDRIGRRPVILFGLCGVVGSTLLFGLSGSYIMMLVSRALSGALNGNVAVIKSVMGEITDETNQGAAFVYLPLCWSLGSLIAPFPPAFFEPCPVFGGFLSHPSERYPSVFGSSLLFQRYPYLLPCLAGSAFSTVGLVAGFLFLEESLAEKKPKSSLPSDPERRPLLPPQTDSLPRRSLPTHTGLASPELAEPERPVPSMSEIFQAPAVRRVLLSYGFMSLVAAAVNAIFVLWLYTPVKSGGIGFSTAEIGAALTSFGILCTGINLIAFPPIERRFGTTLLFQFGMIMQVVLVATFPLGHIFAKMGGNEGAYMGVGGVVVVRSIGEMVFVCNMLLVRRSAPSPRALGTVNGLAQMVASASRTVGPAYATSLFAFSMESNILGGNLVWVVLALVAALGCIAAFRLPNDCPASGSESELESPNDSDSDP